MLYVWLNQINISMNVLETCACRLWPWHEVVVAHGELRIAARLSFTWIGALKTWQEQRAWLRLGKVWPMLWKLMWLWKTRWRPTDLQQRLMKTSSCNRLGICAMVASKRLLQDSFFLFLFLLLLLLLCWFFCKWVVLECYVKGRKLVCKEGDR